MSDEAILAVIPARFASVRFPGKPLHTIAGKPLIQHVWERCQEAGSFQSVIVATDDTRILHAVEGFGGLAQMTRSDHPSGTDRVAQVARELPNFGIVFNVQGDEPMIDPALLRELARQLSSDPHIAIATAATPVDLDEAAHPNNVKVVRGLTGDALYFSRALIPHGRGSSGHRILKHLGVYGYRRDALLRFVSLPPSELEQTEQLEQLRALENGMKIRVVLTASNSVGVDSPEDAGEVERLFQSFRAPEKRRETNAREH